MFNLLDRLHESLSENLSTRKWNRHSIFNFLSFYNWFIYYLFSINWFAYFLFSYNRSLNYSLFYNRLRNDFLCNYGLLNQLFVNFWLFNDFFCLLYGWFSIQYLLTIFNSFQNCLLFLYTFSESSSRLSGFWNYLLITCIQLILPHLIQ